MPKTKVILYRETDGTVPLLDWLDKLPEVARDKCMNVIELLADSGTNCGHAAARSTIGYCTALRGKISSCYRTALQKKK